LKYIIWIEIYHEAKTKQLKANKTREKLKEKFFFNFIRVFIVAN